MAWTATVALVLTVAALIAGVPPAAADLGARLSYDCTTPVGTRKAQVDVAAATPTVGRVGKELRLGQVRISVQMPSDSLAKGAGSSPSTGALVPAEVSGSVRLAVAVAQNGQTANAGWPPFQVVSAAQSGRQLRLTAVGKVPSLAPRAPGEVVWSANDFALTLTPELGAVPVVVKCAPKAIRPIGRVTIRNSGAVPGRQPGPGSEAGIPEGPNNPPCYELPQPPPGTDINNAGLNPDPALNPMPPLFADEIKLVRVNPRSICTKLAGFASIAKLGGVTPVAGEGLARDNVVAGTLPLKNHFYRKGYGLAQTVPSRATLLGFGFMPTTATAVVNQVATPKSKGNNYANIAARLVSDTNNPFDFTGALNTKANIVTQVKEAALNGVPLGVGRKCRTGTAVLDATSDQGNQHTGIVSPDEAASLTGSVTVPAFSGCGVDEDLSPLFTASIAGPGNDVRLDVGAWCVISAPGIDCDVSREPYMLRVAPGGKTTLTIEPFVLPGISVKGVELRCASAKLQVNLKKGRWNSGIRIAMVTGAKFSKCATKGLPPAEGEPAPVVPQEVTADGLPWGYNATRVDTSGTVPGILNGVLINAKGDDGCLLRFGFNSQSPDPDTFLLREIPVNIPVTLDSKTRLWKPDTSHQIQVTQASRCAHDIPGFLTNIDQSTGEIFGEFFGFGDAPWRANPEQTITSP